MKRSSVLTARYRTRSTPSSAWGPWKIENYVSTEETFSINHYPLNTKGDDGGPWMLFRSTDRPTFGTFDGTDSGGNLNFDGQLTVQRPSSWTYLAAPSDVSDSELDSNGTTAIARTAPTNPAFDMSTALGELAQDGFPMVTGGSLFKERVQAARSAGGEYLNVEFGWLPLVRDLQSFAKTVKDSHKILDQYRKGSDTKIRTAYDFSPSETTRTYIGGGFLSHPVLESSGQGTLSETHRSKAWFRGAFRYHIPVADDVLGKFQQWSSMSDHLLGWKVTPETVWNIAPWSWAADWFGNTGDVLANVSNLGKDGLVLQYGYSMAHRQRHIQLTATFNERYGQTITPTRDYMYEWKRRRPATPYGFGVNLQTLSAKQIAIIAALGLSRT